MWVLDGLFDEARVAVQNSVVGLEVIIVSIGCPRGTSTLDFITQRELDLTPPADYFPRSSSVFRRMGSWGLGGGALLRDYLIDELRPELSAAYRMDPADHCLVGMSLSGVNTFFTMLTRPAAYSRYLMASTGFWGMDYVRLEQEYADSHDDLDAQVYVSAGGGEMMIPDWPLVPGMTDVVQRLLDRGYPSLRLTPEVIGDYIHTNVLLPSLVNGFRVLYAEKEVELPVTEFYDTIMDAGWARTGSGTPWAPPS